MYMLAAVTSAAHAANPSPPFPFSDYAQSVLLESDFPTGFKRSRGGSASNNQLGLGFQLDASTSIGLDARYEPIEKNGAFAASETKSFAAAYPNSYINLGVGDASYAWHNGDSEKPGHIATATAKIYDGSYKIEVVVRGYLKSQPQERIDLAIRLVKLAHQRLKGYPRLADTLEYRYFTGTMQPLRPPSVWQKDIERWVTDLRQTARAFPGVHNHLEIPGEMKRSLGLPDFVGPTLARHIGLGGLPMDEAAANSNPYSIVTKETMPALKAAIEKLPGNSEPAAVLKAALDVSGGSYPLAVLTAHNLLKSITFEGRTVIEVANKNFETRAYPIHFRKARETLGEYKNLVSRLASLRTDPIAQPDKMGPWYHLFAVLTAAAVGEPGDGTTAANMEHAAKKAGVFLGEAGPNYEKETIDKAFGLAADAPDLAALSRNKNATHAKWKYVYLVPYGWTVREDPKTGDLEMIGPAPTGLPQGVRLNFFMHDRNLTTAEVLSKTLEMIKQEAPGLSQGAPRDCKIGGLPGKLIPLEGEQASGYVAHTSRGQDGMVVMLVGPREADAQFRHANAIAKLIEFHWLK